MLVAYFMEAFIGLCQDFTSLFRYDETVLAEKDWEICAKEKFQWRAARMHINFYSHALNPTYDFDNDRYADDDDDNRHYNKFIAHTTTQKKNESK